MRKGNSTKEILLDTNILKSYLNELDQNHQAVVQKLAYLRGMGYVLLIAPQCLYELWVVLTRPIDQNGFGKIPQDAHVAIQTLRSQFELWEDPPGMVDEWQSLCQTYRIQGRRAHDVRLVAWMIKHGVRELLTLNPRDFQVFGELITVLTP